MAEGSSSWAKPSIFFIFTDLKEVSEAATIAETKVKNNNNKKKVLLLSESRINTPPN